MPSGILSRLFSFEQAVIARNSRNLLSNTSPRRVIPRSYTMAASGSGSKAMFSDICFDDMITNCANGLDFSKHMGVFFSDRTRSSCLRASMKVKSRGFCDSRLVCQYSLIGSAQRKSDPSKVIVGPMMKNSHSASSLCFSVGPARDVSLEGDSRDGQSLDSTLVSGQVLKLLSGSCYLPHPDKEETGGEDAHFICDDNKVIGVADGVGGWAEVGINAGEYSRELMSKSVIAIQDEPRDCIDPSRVLEKAYSCTIAQGSSTACIIALTKEGVHAINLGDSGFMVIREGCTIFQSPVQQHSFNLTYQLECGSRSDLPSSGQVFKFPVAPGDVIIAGTDGLFDNLYNNEVTAVVVHSVRAGFGPQTTAQKIAALARERAQDRNRQTPFSTAAQDAGYRYYGGKLDDITVVVSYITG